MGKAKAKAPPPPGIDNMNIYSSGSQAIADANTILWDGQWVDRMNQTESDSKPYGHDCGAVLGNPSKSKDQAAVESLNTIKDRSNALQGNLKNLIKNIYYNANNGAYIERMKTLATIGVTTGQFMDIYGSNIFLIPSEVSTKTELENQRTSDITGKVDTEKIRGAKEKKRGEDLDKSQVIIRNEFEEKKRDLNGRINVFNGKITDAKTVKGDRNSKKNTLINLKQKTDVQYNISGAVSTSLSNAAAVTEQHLNYLKDRVKTTKNNAVDSYEEFYKAIILQNNLLEIAKSDIDSNISTTQRNSKFVSNKKTFINDIYIKLYVLYYIFIVFFIGFIIIYKKLWSIYYKIGLIIAGITFPLVSITVESWMYNSWLYVLSLLTGSVYVYRQL